MMTCRPDPCALTAARWQVPRGRDKVVLRDATVRGLSLAIGRVKQRWCFEYKIPLPAGGWSGGRRLVLGDYPEMDVEAARAAALLAKGQASAGIDPADAYIRRRMQRPSLKQQAIAKARAARGGAGQVAEPVAEEPTPARKRRASGAGAAA